MLQLGFKYILFLILLIASATASDCSALNSLTTIHSCLSCNFLWEIQMNKCIQFCQKTSEFYNSATMRCESCPEKCELCKDQNQCQKCIGSLKFNEQLNKCACTIDGCIVCDLKGERCRQCANGYEIDMNLKCVKSQPKLLIDPQQGVSLKTSFNFSIVNTLNQNIQFSKQFKCFIIGINFSTFTNLQISSGSCSFSTFLPTIHNIEIHIYEYTTQNSTGETTQTNHYIYFQSISVVSPFSSLNNLWNYIQDSIKPVDSLPLQILTLYEYSHLIQNNCLSGGYCLSSGNICYTPENNCICGTNSYSGMRDCSSMKSTEELFYTYLMQVYNICIKSFKGLDYNISCPKPLTYELPNDEQKFIKYLLEKSDFFIEDNEFILTLRNSLKSLDNNQILNQIFPYIIQRYVGKYDKIFSKVDNQNNLLIVYNNENNLSVDYSILLQNQIPITFFEVYAQTISQSQPLQSLKSSQESYQQIVFSNFPQNIINKYTEQNGQQFQYIKLANQQKQKLTYQFNSQSDFNQNQLICLQAKQIQIIQNMQNKEPLILCDYMIYNTSTYTISCECEGDTFLFLNDSQNLYLNREDYENIVFSKNNLQIIQQVEESEQNHSYVIAIVLSVLGAIILILLTLFYFYRRKAKILVLQNAVEFNSSPPQSIKQKIQSSPETNLISIKQQSDLDKQNENEEILSVQIQIENNIIQQTNNNQINVLCIQNDQTLQNKIFSAKTPKESVIPKNNNKSFELMRDKLILVQEQSKNQIEQDLKLSHHISSNRSIQMSINKEINPLIINIKQLQYEKEHQEISQKVQNQNSNNSQSQILQPKLSDDTSIKFQKSEKLFKVQSSDSHQNAEIKQNNLSSILPDTKSILFVENLSELTLNNHLSSQNDEQHLTRQKRISQKNQKHKLLGQIRALNQIGNSTSNLKRKQSQIQVLKKTNSQNVKQSDPLQITLVNSNNIQTKENNDLMNESNKQMKDSISYLLESNNLMKASTKSQYH